MRDMHKNILTVFETWKFESKKIEQQIQQTQHSSLKGKGPQMVDIERNPIYIRINKVNAFRYSHNQLKQIILKTISKSVTSSSGKDSGQRNFEEKALADINEAYNQFLSINVLDISKEGQDMWESTKRNYDTKIDRVE